MPLKVIDIESPYSAEEVRQRLSLIVRPGGPGWLGGGLPKPQASESGQTPEFFGHVEASHFKLVPIIYYRNSFVPTIRGTVVPSLVSGSKVRLVLTLHPLVALFMLCWFGYFGRSLFTSRSDDWGVPALVILFGLLMTLGGFAYEASKAEGILRKWLGAA